MVAYKTGSFQRILKSLEPSCRAGLVYGPDAGLVAERAAALTDVFAGKRKDAVEIVRLDEKDLAEDPARLEVELRTIPMFADGKVVRVAAGARTRRSHAEGAARSAARRRARHRGGRAQARLGFAQIVREPQDGRGAAELQRRALGLAT